MNKTYISIRITYYNNHRITPDVYYYRNDGKGPALATFDKLTPLEANLLMWELVKLGGKNTYEANYFDNAISSRQVVFYGQL